MRIRTSLLALAFLIPSLAFAATVPQNIGSKVSGQLLQSAQSVNPKIAPTANNVEGQKVVAEAAAMAKTNDPNETTMVCMAIDGKLCGAVDDPNTTVAGCGAGGSIGYFDSGDGSPGSAHFQEPSDYCGGAKHTSISAPHVVFCDITKIYFSDCLSQNANALVRQDPTKPHADSTYILTIKNSKGEVAHTKVYTAKGSELKGTIEGSNLDFTVTVTPDADGVATVNYHFEVASTKASVGGVASLSIGQAQSVAFGSDATATIQRM